MKKASALALLALTTTLGSGSTFTVTTTNGDVIRYKYEPLQLELMGRRENFDVIETPESVPNLLGQAPLEVLEFVVDLKRQRLIPNPAHGGEQMAEEYVLREPHRWPARKTK